VSDWPRPYFIPAEDLFQAAEERERSRIVAWLWKQHEMGWPDVAMEFTEIARAIEAGEHLKDEPSRPSSPPGEGR
jgi:hypothetical protein